MNKYKNKLTVVDDIKFASQREATRYCELRLLLKMKHITDLRLQVKYELLPKREGERAASYIADFTYTDKDGVFHCEDSKGKRTDAYILKRKMMLFFHGIRIEEV